jgi:hypothetical protein
LQELDAVAERIACVKTPRANRLLATYFVSRRCNTIRKRVDIVDEQARMGELGRGKIRVRTEVYFLPSGAHPKNAAPRPGDGTRDFLQAEDAEIERAALFVPSDRHADLHMIDTDDAHAAASFTMVFGGRTPRRWQMAYTRSARFMV